MRALLSAQPGAVALIEQPLADTVRSALLDPSATWHSHPGSDTTDAVAAAHLDLYLALLATTVAG